MTRVLYVSDSLKQRFGVTSVILNLIENFHFDSLVLDVLVYDDSEIEIINRLKEKGVGVYFMPRLSLGNVVSFRNYLNSFFKSHSYDIVHSHFNQVDGLLFHVARHYGVKCCISHSHNTKLSDYKLKAIRNRLLCWNIGNNADVWAACSELAGKALFGKKYTSSNKKMLIRNGVDCEKFAFSEEKREEVRRELAIGNDQKVLGHVGSFKPQKNHSFLLRVFSELIKNEDNYTLVMVGDGADKTEIQRQVQELGIQQKVIFTGVRNDVPDILCAIDAFLLPSLYEGLPVIGIEAQASGLECIFSDTITKEVDLTGVRFVAIDEVRPWVDAIRSLSLIRNAKATEKIINSGYSISFEAKRLQLFYDSILLKKSD